MLNSIRVKRWMIKSNGYKVNDVDKCVYTKFTDQRGVIICLYVDDMLIFGTDIEAVKGTKKYLSSKFNIKDMGLADVILGIKIVRTTKGCALTQSHYIENIFAKYKYFDLVIIYMVYYYVLKLEENSGNVVRQLEYFKVVGSLMYAMNCTRLDIAFAVSTTRKQGFSHRF